MSLSLLALGLTHAQASEPIPSSAELEHRIVAHHAAWSAELYRQTHGAAKDLSKAVDVFLQDPTEETLSQARDAWIEARSLYGRTEVFRFHDGPIETLEPLINAWPVDEAFIDYVVGREEGGIIQSPTEFPSLAPAVLEMANERGGEANICVGWHAIEFMLWGQDLAKDGPGARPATDFVLGTGPYAKRRQEYLRSTCQLLVKHLQEAQQGWAPERDNYRSQFVAETDASLRRILVGATVLSAFELGGERLTVAFDTRDQEQEHSCFSDQTRADLLANQQGILDVMHGRAIDGKAGPGLLHLVRSRKPKLADAVAKGLARTQACLEKIPQPFDQAILGQDDSPGRQAIHGAILALEDQTELLLIVGEELGYQLPLEPGG